MSRHDQPVGETLYYITVAYAQLERGMIAERVKAGRERARRQGRHVGRPAKADPEGLATAWRRIHRAILDGELSRRQAAKRLGTSERTVRRLLAETPHS